MLSDIPLSKIFLDSEVKTFLVDINQIPIEKDIVYQLVLTKNETNQIDKLKHQNRAREYLYTRIALKQLLDHKWCFARNEFGYIDFPANWIGSISHKNGLIVLAIADKKTYWGLGVDIEMVQEENLALAEKVICKENMNKPFASSYKAVTNIFSAKESLFKCHFPTGKKMFYFHDAFTTAYSENNVDFSLLVDTTPITQSGYAPKSRIEIITRLNFEYVITLSKEMRK